MTSTSDEETTDSELSPPPSVTSIDSQLSLSAHASLRSTQLPPWGPYYCDCKGVGQRHLREPHYHRTCKCQRCLWIDRLTGNLICLCKDLCWEKLSFDEPGSPYDLEDDEVSLDPRSPSSTPTSRRGAEEQLSEEEKRNVCKVSGFYSRCTITFCESPHHSHVIPRSWWSHEAVRVHFPLWLDSLTV